jgi:membrane protease YdiL (CAAX protease family)
VARSQYVSDYLPPAHGPESSNGNRRSEESNEPAAGLDPEPRPLAARAVAAIEVLLCSDVVTQLAIGGTLTALGYQARTPSGQLSIGYVVALSLGDAVLLVGLIFALLYAHGERPGEVFLGRRRVLSEAVLGLWLIPITFGIALTVILTVRRFAPSLHNVEQNPLQGLLGSPRDAWWFALVVLVAGGLREEIQRAFLLHRFDRWLGGSAVGLIVTSVAFGAGHYDIQGLDAGIATGLLGAFWAAVYLRRRSSVAPIVSHASFDLLQIVQFLGIGGS